MGARRGTGEIWGRRHGRGPVDRVPRGLRRGRGGRGALRGGRRVARVDLRRHVALAWGGRGRRREPLADDRRERGARDDGRGGARSIDRACQGNRPEIGPSWGWRPVRTTCPGLGPYPLPCSWLSDRASLGPRSHRSPFCAVLIEPKHHPARAGVADILARHADGARRSGAGIPEGVSPHSFRHQGATGLPGAGASLVHMRDPPGRGGVATTGARATAGAASCRGGPRRHPGPGNTPTGQPTRAPMAWPEALCRHGVMQGDAAAASEWPAAAARSPT